jgi:hypothetical protein
MRLLSGQARAGICTARRAGSFLMETLADEADDEMKAM